MKWATNNHMQFWALDVIILNFVRYSIQQSCCFSCGHQVTERYHLTWACALSCAGIRMGIVFIGMN